MCVKCALAFSLCLEAKVPERRKEGLTPEDKKDES